MDIINSLRRLVETKFAAIKWEMVEKIKKP